MIYISVKLNSPLAISKGRFVGNEDKSLNYIPGSAFRGAVAERLLGERDESDPTFKDVFIKGAGIFPNLYPYKRAKFSLPLPRSVRTCKYKSGFYPEGGHKIFDSLFSSVNGSPLEECPWPECKAPLELAGDFYEECRGEYRLVQEKKRWITRTAIEDVSQTAREGFLYAIEVMEEEQYFSGIMEIKGASLENGQVIMSGRSLLKKGDILRIGLGKTRGLGEVEIDSINKIEDVFPPKLIPGKEVKDRFDRFNENRAFKSFSLTLCSDAIILDDFLRYKPVIDEQALESEFGFERGKIELKRAFTQTHLVSGWNQALGLPKEDELAIEKGSVFLFECNEGYDPVSLLEKVETEGIGERKEEGFGRVIVCHSFHLDAKGGL